VSQAKRVLAYLKTGRVLTRRIALDELGIWEGPARVSELRRAGYAINTVTEIVTNRFGDDVRVANWSMEGGV
jgi:hypothetical protein